MNVKRTIINGQVVIKPTTEEHKPLCKFCYLPFVPTNAKQVFDTKKCADAWRERNIRRGNRRRTRASRARITDLEA